MTLEHLEKLQRIPTAPGMGRSIVQHDRRSRGFRATDLLPASPTVRDRTWRRGAPYDQGQTPECVAYTGKGLMNTTPTSGEAPYDVRSKYSTEDFYEGARRNDEWAGEDYDGTSALGLCRYLTQIGIIREYRWCFGLTDVLLTLSNIGPVGIGIWWRGDMFNPDSRGLIHATGANEGGHETQLLGVDMKAQEVIGCNSWGPDWGVKGRFRLSWTDLESLLGDDGDAVVILQ